MILNNGETSFFDRTSFIISLKYGEDDFHKAFYELKKNHISLKATKSFLHEHAHYIQFSTTTIGYYLKLLKDYQLQRILCCLAESAKTDSRTYPLFDNIYNFRNGHSMNKKAIHHYYYWLLCELIHSLMMGEDGAIKQYARKHMMGGMGFWDYFLEQDLEFKRIFDINPVPFKEIDYSYNLKQSFKIGKVISMFSNLSIASLIESEALLTEYYFDEVADERLLQLLKTRNINGQRGIDYFLPLIIYCNANNFDLKNKRDFLRFKLGFHGICQTVLNTPLLPFQERNMQIRLHEIDLRAKFLMLLFSPLSNVSPPESEGEYAQFLDELLQRFDFISANKNYLDIIKNEKSIMSKLLSPTVFKEKVFINAQKQYNKDPLNYYRYLSGIHSEVDAFCLKFINRDLEYPLENIEYLILNLVEQFYKELLYGYSVKQSPNNIYVRPPVRVSKETLINLQFIIDAYNEILNYYSPHIPKMKIYEYH